MVAVVQESVVGALLFVANDGAQLVEGRFEAQ